MLVIVPWIIIGWNAPLSGVPNDATVFAPTLYGGGVTYSIKQVYSVIGNPANLPASVVFAARYGAPLRAFDLLATEGVFAKSYRTGESSSTDEVSFYKPPVAYLSGGIHPVAGAGTKSVGLGANEHGHFVVTLFWPWVTSIKIWATSRSQKPATLTIRTRSPYLVTRDVGRLTFHGDETLELAVPRDAFDSGINEVLLETDGDIELRRIQWIDTSKHDRSLRLFE